jgi:hypothetical protein
MGRNQHRGSTCETSSRRHLRHYQLWPERCSFSARLHKRLGLAFRRSIRVPPATGLLLCSASCCCSSVCVPGVGLNRLANKGNLVPKLRLGTTFRKLRFASLRNGLETEFRSTAFPNGVWERETKRSLGTRTKGSTCESSSRKHLRRYRSLLERCSFSPWERKWLTPLPPRFRKSIRIPPATALLSCSASCCCSSACVRGVGSKPVSQ